jgi:hypothetical protein
MSQKLRVFDRINRIYWIIESMLPVECPMGLLFKQFNGTSGSLDSKESITLCA